MRVLFFILSLLIVLTIFNPLLVSSKLVNDNDDEDVVDRNQAVVDYDDEEFVGVETLSASEPQKAKETVEEIKKLIRNDVDVPVQNNYIIEILFISFIVLYAVNFFNGKRKNENIASTWIETVQPALSANFTRYGDGSVVKQTHSSFTVSADGRVNCVGLQATLELRKRHDLASVFGEFIWKGQDTLTIDVAMEDKAMDPFVFAIVKRKEEKRFKKAYADVNEHAVFCTRPELPDSFSVLAEFPEVVDSILTPEVVAALKTHEADFIKMHFSDQDTLTPKYKKMLHFQFRIPSDPAKLEVLTRMAIHMIDVVANVKLSAKAKAKSDKTRIAILEKKEKEKNAQRQEAAQQRKFEKQQKEKEKLELLSADERAKREEKEAKKEQKRKMSKFKLKFG